MISIATIDSVEGDMETEEEGLYVSDDDINLTTTATVTHQQTINSAPNSRTIVNPTNFKKKIVHARIG